MSKETRSNCLQDPIAAVQLVQHGSGSDLNGLQAQYAVDRVHAAAVSATADWKQMKPVLSALGMGLPLL